MKQLSHILLLVLAAFACKEASKKEESGGKKPGGQTGVFDAVVAQEFKVNRSVDAPGTILASETTDLHPETSGRVVAINFKEGSFVAKGTLLVKLFDGDLQAQLKKLRVQLKVAEATERRQKELLAINGTSQQDYDVATLNVSNIKADIELMLVNIAKTEIRAPYNGKLGLRAISLGAYVSPTSPITNIAQVHLVDVQFAVPEKYASAMKPGTTVNMKMAGGSKNYIGTIIAAENTIDANTRNLLVKARLQNPDANTVPGAFVQVMVDFGTSQYAIMVPTQAVVPTTRFKNVYVSENGKAVLKVVNTGQRDSARIEITSGLKAGDTVLTNGLLTIKEGMPIKTRVKP